MFSHSRHIPEEELHAYLDQALSRSQCVEIESHLATCAPCRGLRDDIAALRDRTTALLSSLAPPAIHTPPFAELRQTHLERTARRKRIIQASAWAASILLALGFGWSARAFAPSAESETVAQAPATTPATTLATPPGRAASVPVVDHQRQPAETPSDAGAEPAPSESTPTRTPDPAPAVAVATPVTSRLPTSLADQPLVEEPSLQITSTTIAAEDELASQGVWRTLDWDGAQALSVDEWVPRVSGLPVVDVQVKESADEDAKPLMVVSQRMSGGEVIKTFTGPAGEITDLLARQPGQSVTASLQFLDNEDSLAVGDSLMRQASGDNRVLAIQGSIPVDSLRTLLLRLR